MSTEQQDPVSSSGGRAGRRAAQQAADAAAREARKADQAKRFRRYRWPVLGVVLFLVAVVAIVLVRGGGDDGATASPSGRDQTTVFVQVVPQVGRPAVANALTGANDAGERAVLLTLPNRLITEVAGSGSTTLERTSVSADGQSAGNAIGDQIGVIVDGSWVLTEPAWAALIDKVGGVTVDVDTDVTATQGGARVVTVPQGEARTLSGAQAVEFATFLGPNETEAARMARFSAVFSAFLGKLPDDTEAVRNLVAGSAGSVSTLSPDKLADYLVDLRDAVASDSLAYPTLPTATIDTGTGPVTYRIDATKTAELARTQFAGSLPPQREGGPITVLVQNGVGKPGVSDQARAKLVAAGLTFKPGGNASRFGYRTSSVLISDDTPAAREKGQAVATALGLPASAVRVSAQGQSLADVLVIIGADFKG